MMSAFFVNLLVLFIAGAGSLVIGGIVLNNPPLYSPPGFGERLRTYLTSRVAETQRDHRFPELELRCYALAPGTLFARVEHAVMALGWETIDMDLNRHYLHAVVSTPLLKFKDDLEVHLVPAACGTELHVRSESRLGKGDLGANTRHILDLLATLARQA
jgi:uncharacterized protein (DUF1499 family)